MDGTEVAVRAVETVGTDTVALTLETPGGFDARPGQFVQLAATVDGEEITRHYTLSSPDADETFETTVEVDPSGSLSPYLADLEAGDTVSVAGPFGDAYYEDEDGVVVLAGGPGVGPAVGIGERAVEEGAAVTVVYEDDDPVHQDRLEALADAGATVVITDDVSDQEVVSVLADATGQFFVYGFADFLDRATAALDAADRDAAAAKTENFGPAPDDD
ncbi:MULTISPECIES: ferredoxin--NADP reductase [Halorussus]|uniref:ferredoxin--NADP reductase n=1 Tax=Halorussus TaxID=1070314 RepID=UPI000E20F9F9|nr:MULTISPECIES: FAD-dependent oxidoreductase [Halorussus]NHN57849.1 FAD-dependent oxidoreductase [Halorussus sp. JP-T4]